MAISAVSVSFFVAFPLWKPTTPAWWLIKMLPTVLSPLMFFAGALFLLVGIAFDSLFILLAGTWLIIFFTVHLWRITQPPEPSSAFDQAFGSNWKNLLREFPQRYFLKTRFGLSLPATPDPTFHQNIVFYSLPGTSRQLLCDVWEPSREIPRSGLAFIYLHGSAWYVLDKDTGTRNFFRHLTAQGHVIMDVSYRLCPETDMMGMVHDAKHAIAWMKENADTYRIKANHIVIGGGSAGGHIALLTAYTEQKPRFTPADLIGIDTSVSGVISFYGPTDLKTFFYHTGQNIIYSQRTKKSRQEKQETPAWMKKIIGPSYHRLGFDKAPDTAMLASMFGGSPDEVPEPYKLYSPINHIHPNCPTTFVIQGTHDLITSTEGTKHFYKSLQKAGVPAAMHLLPQIDHAFDLMMPKRSPSAHNAYYDVERFLALLAVQNVDNAGKYQGQVSNILRM